MPQSYSEGVPKHSSVDLAEQQQIACDLAMSATGKSGRILLNSLAIVPSLEIVRRVLCDYETAVAACHLRLKWCRTERIHSQPLVGRVFHGVVAMFCHLYQYGTLKVPAAATNRQTACANSVKLVLAAYQQISSDEAVTNKSLVLSILFRERLAILRFQRRA
jgi:hypothetical protein